MCESSETTSAPGHGLISALPTRPRGPRACRPEPTSRLTTREYATMHDLSRVRPRSAALFCPTRGLPCAMLSRRELASPRVVGRCQASDGRVRGQSEASPSRREAKPSSLESPRQQQRCLVSTSPSPSPTRRSSVRVGIETRSPGLVFASFPSRRGHGSLPPALRARTVADGVTGPIAFIQGRN